MTHPQQPDPLRPWFDRLDRAMTELRHRAAIPPHAILGGPTAAEALQGHEPTMAWLDEFDRLSDGHPTPPTFDVEDLPVIGSIFDLPMVVSDHVDRLAAGSAPPTFGDWAPETVDITDAIRDAIRGSGRPPELWDLDRVPYEDEGWDDPDWVAAGVIICAAGTLVTLGLAALAWWWLR